VDETDISSVQKPGYILETKGQKHIIAAVSWERIKNVSAVYSVSANKCQEVNVPSWRHLFLISRWWITDELYFEWLLHSK
jgi:hypothetical protein